MYVQRKIEARSGNHFYHEKAVSITYSECVSVAVVIQHSKHMRRMYSNTLLNVQDKCLEREALNEQR
jgi:hypothetical protein